MASSSLPEGGAKLTLDLSEWESNWASAIDQADTLQTTIDDLGGTVDVEFNIEDAELPFDEIPESVDTELSVTEDEETQGILEGINFLVALEKIKIAIDVVGTALDFITAVGNFAVAPFLETEEVVARINAQTGGTGMRDLGDFIRDIQAADLGDSAEQIGEVVIAARQLGAPIDEATRASLTFVKVFDDQDPVTVMTTLNTMADQFETSITAAGDMMTVAFQQGLNKGGDLLAVVDANASSWADMGLTAPEVLSTINSLMDSGVASATDAAKMIQTFDDALTAAADNADSPQAEALKTLGLENPKDSGAAMGADFIDGFAASFTNLPADQQDLISGVLFGKGGKKFTGALEGMTTQDNMFQNVIGQAEAAATEVDNHLMGIIDDFVLAFNTKVTELLSSEAIDLPGKITALKEGLQEALDVIASGGSIGEAIEVGLNIPGFNDSVNRFEASIGNFAISILEIIAGIQDFLGKDSSKTREQISTMAGNQLAFDLKVANADEMADEIQMAVDRGLTTSDLATATNTALSELIAGGDLDKAQALVDGLKEVQAGDPLINPDATGVGRQEALTALRTGDLARIQEQIDAGNLIAQVSIDTEAFQAEIDEAQTLLNTKFGPEEVTNTTAVNPWQNLGALNGDGGLLGSLKTDLDVAVASVTDFDTSSSQAAANIAEAFFGINTSAITNIGGTTQQVDDLAAKFEDADVRINTAATGNTITASFEAVATSANSSFPGVINWMDETGQAAAEMDIKVSGHVQHMLNLLQDLQFLSAQVATGVQNALALGAGLGGTTNNTTNNVDISINTDGPGFAASVSQGYSIGRSLRGFG